MIVSCPSCGTRYRHEQDLAGRAARCSRCGEVFPFPAHRAYRVLAAAAPVGAVTPRAAAAEPAGPAAVAAPLAVVAAAARPGYMTGMDDPALAPRLQRTLAAVSSGEGAAVPPRVYPAMHREEEASTGPGDERHAGAGSASEDGPWQTRESAPAHRILVIAALLALLWSVGGEGWAVGALAVMAVVTLAWRGWTWASRRP